MSNKNIAILVLVVAALSAAVTRYYFPQVSTKVEVQEKEVIKKDIKTIIKEIVRPDGTKETVTEVVDHSKESKESKTSITTFKPKDWVIAATAETKDLRQQFAYGIHIQRRILGPVFVGITANTEKQFGASVGLEF